MYAGDTTLCYNLNNSSHNDILNKELHKIKTWLACHKLSLNIDNTKLIILIITKEINTLYSLSHINCVRDVCFEDSWILS